jgi:hypothetical protein
MDSDAPERRTDNVAALKDVNAWFAERGFGITPSTKDYSEQVRASPWAKRAKSQDHHAWVDLTKSDGSVVSPGYGSGATLADAANSARRRWQAEQEGGKQHGPRVLP